MNILAKLRYLNRTDFTRVGKGTAVSPRNLLHCVGPVDGLLQFGVKVNDPPSDGVVSDLVAVVHQDEEQVKSAHDGGRHVDVELEALAPVVPPTNRVGCCQDAGPEKT